MAGICQRKAVIVAETKTACEALLVQIVADKRIADDQEKQVYWLAHWTALSCLWWSGIDGA